MREMLPDDIQTALSKACGLHERAVSDYAQCIEFSRLMSDILSRLENLYLYDTADKVMSILLNCNPKTGAHCDKSTIVQNAVKKLNPAAPDNPE